VSYANFEAGKTEHFELICEPRYDIAPELLKQRARSAASIPLR
jgi:hypothetical protein